MVPTLVLFAFLSVTGAIRDYCGGGTCNTSTDCRQPSGISFPTTVGGTCCNSQCYAAGTIPTLGQGANCTYLDPCKQCAAGYLCVNNLNQDETLLGALGPFSCQQVTTKFTPGCSCKVNGDCLGGICGGTSSLCYASNLFSGSDCSFSEQCISQVCDRGVCVGREQDVPTSTCSSNNECPLGARCSLWGVPPRSICHGLSGGGGVCYNEYDCQENYNQQYPPHACVGGDGSTQPGTCTSLPQKGQACATSTTASECAWFDVPGSSGNYKMQYFCNTSMTPHQCVDPIQAGIPIGSPCRYNINTNCVSGAYCRYDTEQPGQTTGQNGTCTANFQVAKGGKCSSSAACANFPNTECRINSNSTFYECQDISNGKTCNHTNTTLDTVQCPSVAGDLLCGCNDTCQDQPFVSDGCNDATFSPYNSLLNTINPSSPIPAWAYYKGNKRIIADRVCCSLCGTSYETATSHTYGVIVNCESFDISVPQVCDNSGTPVKFLQNCAKYTPVLGSASMLNSSFFAVILSIMFALFARQ